MAGISSKAAGGLVNKHKFNDGTELNTDLGLDFYETPFRGYDAQLGRFWQIDKLAVFSVEQTPYHFGSDNPVLRNDPSGLIDTAANQSRPVILETVVVKPKPKNYSGVNWLNWPSYEGRTGKEIQAETNTQLARKRDGLPYLPYGDTTFYNRAWEADQDWRTMSNGAVVALLAPFAIEGIIVALPTVSTSVSTLSTSVSTLVSETSLLTNYASQVAISNLRNLALRTLLRNVPLSLSLTKSLITLMNKPINTTMDRNLFQATRFILSRFLPSGSLPQSSSIWPKNK